MLRKKWSDVILSLKFVEALLMVYSLWQILISIPCVFKKNVPNFKVTFSFVK